MIDQDECARIRVVQSGGFAGTVTLADVDRASLSPDKAGQLDAIGRELSSAGGSSDGEGEVGADIPRYEVEIQSVGGPSRSYTVPGPGGAGAAPGADINAIVGRLNALSR
jgi:hypothetical protein